MSRIPLNSKFTFTRDDEYAEKKRPKKKPNTHTHTHTHTHTGKCMYLYYFFYTLSPKGFDQFIICEKRFFFCLLIILEG